MSLFAGVGAPVSEFVNENPLEKEILVSRQVGDLEVLFWLEFLPEERGFTARLDKHLKREEHGITSISEYRSIQIVG
jgi:hypothetical protein